MRRLIPLILLSTALAGVGVGPAAASPALRAQSAPIAPPAAAAAESSPAVVLAAAAALVRWHIAAPATSRLLEEAVGGLRRALAKAGIEEAIGALGATNEEEAVTAFRQRFLEARQAAAGRVSDQDLEHEAVRAMTGLLNDSHTGFLTPAAYRERSLRQQNVSSYSGIGILTMRRDGHLYVTRVFPGGPADAAGMRDFDRIVSVDGEPVRPDGESRPLRGEEGTTVEVTVQRHDRREPVALRIVRSMVAAPTVEYGMREHGVGYLRLYRFSRGAAADVRAALQSLIAQRMRALVLDLRGNGGGFVVELNNIADLLMPANTAIYSTETRRDGRSTQVTSDGGPLLDASIPLIVLIDRGTGSAAEMLSAALGESGRARVTGVRSAGAVLVSITLGLPGGAGLSVSIAHVTTAAGAVLERVGVRPGTDVDYDTADLERGIDSQARFAIGLGAQLAGPAPAAGP